MNTPLLTLSAACGICGPVIYALVVFVLGLISPGYSQAAQLMSELGASGAPYALVMNLGGFLLLGILLVIFSFGLYAALKPSLASRAGAILVAIAGLTYIGEAVFSCDKGCIPVTFAGSAHLFIGDLAVLDAVLAAFVLALAMRPDTRWKGYWEYSVASGYLVLVLLPFFPFLVGLTGLMQRVVVAIIFLWLLVIAQKAYRILAEKKG
ncbi:MAG: DUF998 domain-containing protein [Methanomicrobiales archaeon]|nr:DUF998 domain-containing protein [Methanomicrobiales archaeon]